MQIVIPMSGIGKRFQRRGYEMPKPLIDVDGRPIIAHVIDLFPGETDFIFICNNEHLQHKAFEMEKTLQELCPTGQVVGIDPHDMGPVHAVLQVRNLIRKNEAVLVNYCDFSCYWNWESFKTFTLDSNCDGAIPSYRGFHPHSLGTNNYAYVQENDLVVSDIQEKKPFTDDRMNEFASSGSYYFKTGALMFAAFESQVELDLCVNDEFYVSLAYKYLLKLDLIVLVYELEYFMQWGTPDDLLEYQRWHRIFETLSSDSIEQRVFPGSTIVPMAGLGKRFSDEGYQSPKPMISVSGKPMIVQALNDLPKTTDVAIVLRKDMFEDSEMLSSLYSFIPNAEIVCDFLPKGQASSTLVGVKAIKEHGDSLEGFVNVGACDNGLLYDLDLFDSLINSENCDVIVWGVTPDASMIRNAHMYSWIIEKEGIVQKISVKTPPANLENSKIVIGAFTFKRIDELEEAINSTCDAEDIVNNEYYLDTCINHAIDAGLRCKIFEPDYYIGWGTPNDLRTFEYWQSCFHKWRSHIYRFETDSRLGVNEFELKGSPFD